MVQRGEGSANLDKRFYTVLEVAALLRVSRSTVDRLTKARKLPGKMRVGGQVRFFRPSIDGWIADQVNVAG